MSSLRLPGWIDYLLLALLAIAWGAAYTFIKITVGYISPILLVTLRILLGTAFLTTLALLRGYQWPKGWRIWGQLMLLGLLGNVIPFFLIAWGEQHIDSGLAAILAGTIPLMVMVVAHFATKDEKWHGSQALAVALGFCGILTLIGWQALSGIGDHIFGQLSVFGGVLSYALFGILIKRLPPLPSEITVAALLLCASLFIVPISLAIPGTYEVTFAWDWVWSILFLGIVSTGLGNLLFLIILKRTSVNFASLNNYLVPIVGVALGILSLEERPDWNSLIALLLILAGLAVPRLTSLRQKTA